MAFNIDEMIVCTRRHHWVDDETGERVVGPLFEEVVIVTGTHPNDENQLTLQGYTAYSYHKKWFKKTESISELTEILESQPAEV